MSTYKEDAVISADQLSDITELDIVVFRVLESFDYDAQLRAIHALLKRNKEEADRLADEISKIERFAKETTGIKSLHAVDEWVDHMHTSVYQDVAHSMAAVGMLAPFIESVLYRSFYGIRGILNANTAYTKSHERWRWSSEQQWDCHFIFEKGGYRKDFVRGVLQLAEAVGLYDHLPTDFRPTLEALFEYRNKMFHCGFEWPDDARANFDNHVSTRAGWQTNWFAKATHDGKPWIFYLTDTFIDHCFSTLEGVLRGIRTFARINQSGPGGS